VIVSKRRAVFTVKALSHTHTHTHLSLPYPSVSLYSSLWLSIALYGSLYGSLYLFLITDQNKTNLHCLSLLFSSLLFPFLSFSHVGAFYALIPSTLYNVAVVTGEERRTFRLRKILNLRRRAEPSVSTGISHWTLIAVLERATQRTL
jgi:hypothetical protein